MKPLTLIIIMSLFYSCNSSKPMNKNQLGISSPHVYIYKTKADYYSKVPILLSETKEEIISYPHPTDLFINNKLCLPTKLENGYLLDNRGINLNVAFLKMEYSEYSKMLTPPKIYDLKMMIIDNNPLLELYDCGTRLNYDNIEKEINTIIRKGDLQVFKKLK